MARESFHKMEIGVRSSMKEEKYIVHMKRHHKGLLACYAFCDEEYP